MNFPYLIDLEVGSAQWQHQNYPSGVTLARYRAAIAASVVAGRITLVSAEQCIAWAVKHLADFRRAAGLPQPP